MTRIWMAGGAAALLTGCAALIHHGKYDPKAFAPWRIAQDKKIEGRALILSTARDDGLAYSGHPPGMAGVATSQVLPFGVIIREAAKRVLGDLFLGGADTSNDASHLEGYRAVVVPRFSDFVYRVRIFGTSQLDLSVHVALLDARGQAVFEQNYDSGWEDVPPQERADPTLIDRAAHVAAQRVMLQAAADVRDWLLAHSPLSGEPPRGAESPGPGAASP